LAFTLAHHGFPVSFKELLEMRSRDVAYLRHLAAFLTERLKERPCDE